MSGKCLPSSHVKTDTNCWFRLSLVCNVEAICIREYRDTHVLSNAKISNGHVDRTIYFKLKDGSMTRGHNAALVKERCRSDMRNYSFS